MKTRLVHTTKIDLDLTFDLEAESILTVDEGEGVASLDDILVKANVLVRRMGTFKPDEPLTLSLEKGSEIFDAFSDLIIDLLKDRLTVLARNELEKAGFESGDPVEVSTRPSEEGPDNVH